MTMPREKRPTPSLTLALAALLALTGCTGQGINTAKLAMKPAATLAGVSRTPTAPVAVADARLVPIAGRMRAFMTTAGGGTLSGTARLATLSGSDPAAGFFGDSKAAFHLLSPVGVNAGHALIDLSTLEEDLYTFNSKVITGATDAVGAFTLTGSVPVGVPYLVNANLLQNHRLSAIVLPQRISPLVIDESTSAIAEMARWQLRPTAGADADLIDFADRGATDAEALEVDTRSVLSSSDFEPSGGPIYSLDALRAGAGHALRNAYVAAFGGRVTPVADDPAADATVAAANRIADVWTSLLGFRPLALTRVAGNGVRGYNRGEDLDPTETGMSTPVDAVMDSHGHLYVTEQDIQLLRIIPADGSLSAPLLQSSGSLVAGHIATVAGLVSSTTRADYFNGDLDGTDSGAGDDVDLQDSNAPRALMFPNRLVLEPQDPADAVYVSSPFAGRVLYLATADITAPGVTDLADAHFNRSFAANHMYVVAGSGATPEGSDLTDGVPSDEGTVATSAMLGFPTGLARDAEGNLWILESNPGRIRVVRHNDGLMFTLPLTFTPTLNAALTAQDPYLCAGARDLRLSPDGNWIYVAATDDHFVFRVPKPAPATIDALDPADSNTWLAKAAVERVLGNPGKGDSFVDTSVNGLAFPEIYDIAKGLTENASGNIQALLNSPSSLDWDSHVPGDFATANLLVADGGNGRIRALSPAGDVHTIAGGLATRYITGDARLAYLPGLAYLNYCDRDHNVLVVDRVENVVRRLGTARGTLAP